MRKGKREREKETYSSASVRSPWMLAFSSTSMSRLSSRRSFRPSCSIRSDWPRPAASTPWVVSMGWDGGAPRMGISPRLVGFSFLAFSGWVMGENKHGACICNGTSHGLRRGFDALEGLHFCDVRRMWVSLIVSLLV